MTDSAVYTVRSAVLNGFVSGTAIRLVSIRMIFMSSAPLLKRAMNTAEKTVVIETGVSEGALKT